MGKKKKEERPFMIPVAPLGGVPVNGKMDHEVAPTAAPPPSMEAIKQAAEQWAISCGLKPPLAVTDPEIENYPRHGHGFVVHVQETSDRKSMGTAKFTADGKPLMWTIDGIVGS